MTTFQISELAARAGVPATTLRFYEQAGLLTAARSANGYRRYGQDALDRLALIRAGQRLGLPLAQIRDLLTVRDGGVCAEVRGRLRPLLATRIALARERSATLASSIASLEQALAATEPAPAAGPCDSGCGCLTGPAPGPAGGSMPDNSKKNLGQPAPVACTLDGDGQQARLAEWHDLFTRATAREPVPDGTRVTLPGALAGRAADLAAAEQRCCPFFRFALVFDGGDVRLTVQAPPEAGPLLAALFPSEPTDDPGRPVSSYPV